MHWLTTTLAATVLALALGVEPAAGAGDKVYRLEVSGLACPFCVYGLEKEFKGTEGVKDVEVDLAAGRATVTMEEGASLDRQLAEKVVTDAGFTLEGFAEAAGAK